MKFIYVHTVHYLFISIIIIISLIILSRNKKKEHQNQNKEQKQNKIKKTMKVYIWRLVILIIRLCNFYFSFATFVASYTYLPTYLCICTTGKFCISNQFTVDCIITLTAAFKIFNYLYACIRFKISLSLCILYEIFNTLKYNRYLIIIKQLHILFSAFRMI